MQKIFLLLSLFLSTQVFPQYIPQGMWLGQLHRPDGINIPFQLETVDAQGEPKIYILNADERLRVDDIDFSGDSVKVTLPFFDAWFMAEASSYNNISGNYYKRSGDKITMMPFSVEYGNSQRFKEPQPAKFTVSGKWAVQFGNDEKGIGIFNQESDGKVTGTILTPTGDYRYMQGVADNDSLKLSVFDGGFVMLLTAAVKDNNTITGGMLYSGLSAKQEWSAKRNDTVQLDDKSMTKMRPGETKLDFTFPSVTTGNPVSINDAQYREKVVLIQIMGSWCPNCMDETAFLSDYYNKNKHRGLEVIGISYERTADMEKNKKLLAPYISRFQVQYPILVPPVAVSDPERTEKTLPQLDKIGAFPSLIYIDRKGRVRKIHSGFSGPATDEFYEQYKKDFYRELDKLLGE